MTAAPGAAAGLAEHLARVARGRLVAMLAARWGDIAAAEDALADAFAAALDTWPRRGLPDRPEAWLMAAARNRLTDAARRRARGPLTPVDDLPEVEAMIADPDSIPDDRLRLMFACAHPAIDDAIRTPLMLQTVLGLDAARIARAFHLAPAAMAQRLVRAKAKIRDARIGFALPGRAEMAARLPPVLEAIYGAYAAGWMEAGGDDLSEEALYLASLTADLLPDDAEAQGLAALIGLSLSRRPARLDPAGALVPLSAQDPGLWDARLIGLSEARLSRAFGLGAPGRFQIEAAIESAHCARRSGGQTDWPAILTLARHLNAAWPSLGAAVQYAVVLAEVEGPEAGLDALPQAPGFQPALAARAHLLARAGQTVAARAAFAQALSLTAPGPLFNYLHSRAQAQRDG